MKLKKIFIYVLTFILTIGIVTPFMPKKQAKAVAEAMTLYEILMALLGYTATTNEVDISLSDLDLPFDEVAGFYSEESTQELMSILWDNSDTIASVLGGLIVHDIVDDVDRTFGNHILYKTIDPFNYDASDIEIVGGTVNILSNDMESMTSKIAEFLQVPELSNIPVVYTPTHESNAANITSLINKYKFDYANMGLQQPLTQYFNQNDLDTVINAFNGYPYLLVGQTGDIKPYIRIYASTVPMLLYPYLEDGRIYMNIVPSTLNNYSLKVIYIGNKSYSAEIEINEYSGYSVSRFGAFDVGRYAYDTNKSSIEIFNEFNEVVDYNNYDLKVFNDEYEIDKLLYPMSNIDFTIDNDHTYKSFLKSKYGIVTDDERPIVLDIDNWGYLWQTQDMPSTDSITTTDDIMERLRTVDNIGSEVDKSITNTRILTQAEIDDIETDEAITGVIAVQNDIVNNFKGIYAQMPEEVSVPTNILVGLTFIAYVFGGIWTNLGEYAFILVFGCTIGMIAMLIGLGKQIGNRAKPPDKGE